MSSKFGAAFSDTMNVLLLTLRGTPCTYYGEELGLRDVKVTFQQTVDPFGKVFGPVSGQLVCVFERERERERERESVCVYVRVRVCVCACACVCVCVCVGFVFRFGFGCV